MFYELFTHLWKFFANKHIKIRRNIQEIVLLKIFAIVKYSPYLYIIYMPFGIFIINFTLDGI